MILNQEKLYQNVIEPDRDSLIWRYMSFEKFVNLISNQALFFSRLDRFPDQLEGVLPINNKMRIIDEIKNISLANLNHAVSYANREEIIINTYRSYTLANCWTKNDAESMALWKIYLDGTRFGIAIQTQYDKLKNALATSENDVLIGEVQYCDELCSLQQQTISLRKTIPYKFENEVRAVIFNQYTSEGPRKGHPKYEYGVEVKIEIEKLIDKVYLPPLCQKWYEQTIENLIKKYDFKFTLVKSAIAENL